MEVKKIVEGMTAPQVAQVIDDNFKAQNRILEDDIATQNSVIGVSEYKLFSETESVNVGDVRLYDGMLYECVEATQGAWDASKWKKSSFKAETEKKLSELGSKVIETNIIRTSIVRDGFYIERDTGNIIHNPTVTSYKLIRFNLDEGQYDIKSIGSGTQDTLWEYTDDTYMTPKKQIVGNVANFEQIIYIQKGYYAFSWNGYDVSNDIDDLVSIRRIVIDEFSKLNGVQINSGLYIDSNGVIQSGHDSYKLAKIHLNKGVYTINTQPSSSGFTLCKYIDDTYTNLDKVIIGNSNSRVASVIELEDGYYAIGWNDVVAGASKWGRFDSYISNAPYIAAIKGMVDDIFDSVVYKNYITSNVTSIGAYLAINTGIITYNAPKSYKVAKVFIKKGRYDIKSIGSGTQDTLWKYTDNTYLVPEKQIVGNLSSDTKLTLALEEGYYAFSWNDKLQTLEDIPVSIVAAMDISQNNSQATKRGGSFVSDFSEFEAINSSFFISENNKIATNVSNGYENRLQLKYNLYEDNMNLSAKFKIINTDNGYFEFCLGKWHQLVGTMFGFGIDSNGFYIRVYKTKDDLSPIEVHRYSVDGVTFRAGDEFVVNIEKRTVEYSYFNVRIIDARGVVYEISGIGSGDVIEGDTSDEGNGQINGYAWGKICLYALCGIMNVSNISFGYPVRVNELKLVVVGHSFIEGNSIPLNKSKRFASLICQDLGDDSTLILGQGGANCSTILNHIEKELDYLSSSKYVLFCIGTNDSDSDGVINALNQINEIAKNNEIKPIWLTVPPRYGIGETHPNVNTYIKENFNYVDINNVFYKDGILNKEMFLGDGVHPSIVGHERIYNIIKANCQYLYCI